MPQEKPFAGNVSFRAGDDTETLTAIQAKHGMPPGKLAEMLTHEACKFFREHGFFSFPVRIEPEAFQRQWLAHAAEQGQAPYALPSAPDLLAGQAKASKLAKAAAQGKHPPQQPKPSRPRT